MISRLYKISKVCIKDLVAIPYYIRTIDMSIDEIKKDVERYIDSQRMGGYGFRFSDSSHASTLFSSVYALMIFGLIGTTVSDTDGWYTFLDSFQENDGIWRDRTHPFRNWKQHDDEWNDIHIIPHIIYAYEAIGKVPNKRFAFLDKFKNTDKTEEFCNSIDYENFWGDSNGIMNYTTSMIYARDVFDDVDLQPSISIIMSHLKDRMDETGGLWTRNRDKESLYEAIRGGYHIWMLMLKEGVEIAEKHVKNIIDTILLLQNRFGGYNSHFIADTCHNIDCIDPLVRFSLMVPDYRRNDVEESLNKAKVYLLNNKNMDGGFCFGRLTRMRYGNDDLSSRINESNLFGTWFTLLALLIIEDYYSDKRILSSDLPGMEYRIKNKD